MGEVSEMEGREMGVLLRRLRQEANMTQRELAETLHVSAQAVSKWETGAADPSTANLLALAKLYGVSPEELLHNAQSEDE